MTRTWTAFEEQPLDTLTITKRGHVVPLASVLNDYEKAYADTGNVRWFQNNLYLVQVTRGEAVPCASSANAGSVEDDMGDDWPEMIWLSIRRRERAKLPRDWRDLQRIKNELVGPEHEAVELFPAESRLVDESDQFHLWVLASSTTRLPFGYVERSVLDDNDRAAFGAGGSQRPL